MGHVFYFTDLSHYTRDESPVTLKWSGTPGPSFKNSFNDKPPQKHPSNLHNRMTLTIQGPGAEAPVCLLCPNLSATNRYRPETGQETKSDHFLSCFLPQQVSGTTSKVLVKSVPPQRSTTIAAMPCQPASQCYSRSLQGLWTPATASCHLTLRWWAFLSLDKITLHLLLTQILPSPKVGLQTLHCAKPRSRQ